jgi:hypothetical protein
MSVDSRSAGEQSTGVIAADRMSPVDVKRPCVPPFLALGIRRRTSNSLFELLRQSESPLLGNVADDQIAASVVGPRGERQIAAAL